MSAHWQTGEPPRGVWLRVWWHVTEVTAQWDGCNWRDRQGLLLAGPVTHWRETPQKAQLLGD